MVHHVFTIVYHFCRKNCQFLWWNPIMTPLLIVNPPFFHQVFLDFPSHPCKVVPSSCVCWFMLPPLIHWISPNSCCSCVDSNFAMCETGVYPHEIEILTAKMLVNCYIFGYPIIRPYFKTNPDKHGDWHDKKNDEFHWFYPSNGG